jgi:hypothetical protein
MPRLPVFRPISPRLCATTTPSTDRPGGRRRNILADPTPNSSTASSMSAGAIRGALRAKVHGDTPVGRVAITGEVIDDPRPVESERAPGPLRTRYMPKIAAKHVCADHSSVRESLRRRSWPATTGLRSRKVDFGYAFDVHRPRRGPPPKPLPTRLFTPTVLRTGGAEALPRRVADTPHGGVTGWRTDRAIGRLRVFSRRRACMPSLLRPR